MPRQLWCFRATLSRQKTSSSHPLFLTDALAHDGADYGSESLTDELLASDQVAGFGFAMVTGLSHGCTFKIRNRASQLIAQKI
jgi:hypothetical protein